jgi:hypothetical protein
MKIDTMKQHIPLFKKITLVIALLIWAKILYEILQFSGGFGAQAPYCIAGTMLTFGIATMVYKGLEYWERQE